MNFLSKLASLAVITLFLLTITFYASAQAVVILAFSPILVASLNANESMEIIISDLGPPPDQAENKDPGLNGWKFALYDSDGNQLIEVPAENLPRKGFVYLRLAASNCEMGMSSCALIITGGGGGRQQVNLKPLGDRIVFKTEAVCEGKCERRVVVQQNLLDSNGNTIDVIGHIDHGKTTLTAAITRID